jgi:hypothetical protein
MDIKTPGMALDHSIELAANLDKSICEGHCYVNAAGPESEIVADDFIQ